MIASKREMTVLRELCLGSVEHPANFHNVGEKTLREMLEKGWIVAAVCETYGTEGYKITEIGNGIYSAPKEPKQTQPSKLKMLKPRIQTLKSRW